MDFRFLGEDEVFPYTRAIGVGLSPPTVRRACRSGQIAKLHRGWYATRQPRDPADRHRLRLTALLQEYGDSVRASHASAVVWYRLPLHEVELGTVQLMWTRPDIEFRSYSRVKIHEHLPGDWSSVHPHAVDLALALVQMGMTSIPSMLVAGDAALRQGSVAPEGLKAAARALRGQRGITAARASLDSLDGRHESPGESLTAALLQQLGYATIPQLLVWREESPTHYYVADFLIKGTRVIVEFDGREKYLDADALFMEKRREDELRRMGYVVVRLTWTDLKRPAEVRRRIDAAITLSQQSLA